MVTLEKIKAGPPWGSTSRPLPTAEDIEDRLDLLSSIVCGGDIKDTSDVIDAIRSAFFTFTRGRRADDFKPPTPAELNQAISVIDRVINCGEVYSCQTDDGNKLHIAESVGFGESSEGKIILMFNTRNCRRG